MTVFNHVSALDPASWDVDLTQTGNITSVFVNPYLEWMFCGDIDKYGPRGNNQFAFQFPEYLPEQYLVGAIAQSWDFSLNPMVLTIKVKQGIMWTGNAHINMAPRELTASDCALSGTRTITAPSMAPYFTWIKDCVAVDKYTFKWDLNSYQANWPFFLIYGGGLATAITPESVAAGAADWRNQTGTGPFILTDYVSGSSATYQRNPNYWGKSTINGKQYQEPFIDSLSYPVIPDQSTQLAALRTGKIDLWTEVPQVNGATLKQQAPNMIQEPWLAAAVDILRINRIDGTDALKNLNVRQALSMATDFKTIMNIVYGTGDILGWPVSRGNPAYTPIENLPASTQALFTYNPTKAKQMIIDAGFPNGFTTTVTVNSSLQNEIDEATILASEWAKVGVTLQITQMNTVAIAAAKNNRTYKGILIFPVATANALTPVSYYQGQGMGTTYSTGEPLDIASNAVLAETDSAKRLTLLTQFCKDAIADAGIMFMANPNILCCYWPWLKNYYGEVSAGYHSEIPMVKEIWIDQTLKKSLGY